MLELKFNLWKHGLNFISYSAIVGKFLFALFWSSLKSWKLFLRCQFLWDVIVYYDYFISYTLWILCADCRQVSSNDYPSLDSLTKSIVKEKQPFVRLELSKEDLLEMFKVSLFHYLVETHSNISVPIWPPSLSLHLPLHPNAFTLLWNSCLLVFVCASYFCSNNILLYKGLQYALF